MHPIQDKASQFSTLPTQDEWCGRSGQQKCENNYSQGYRDIQRLAREVPFAFHTYRTGVQTSTGATPYSLVYKMEDVLPIEVEIPSLRVLREVELEEAEWVQARYEQLNLIEKKRMKAICHGQLYQKRMMRAHDKKIRARHFQEGKLVLKQIS